MNKTPLINRIYIWSVVLETLLFFVISDRLTAGIGGNVSRILQGIVLIAIMLQYFIKPVGFWIKNIANQFYQNYLIYLGIAIIAGLVGVVSGSYESSVSLTSGQSYFANLLNSTAVRPIFEYVIAIYYFIYFIVLPCYMLKTEAALLNFFSVFRTMFIISLVVGFVDLAFAVGGINLVPRNIADWVYVGARFHGLAGEPREAFVYLFFGLAILHLEAYMKKRSLNKFLVIAIIAAAIMTQSASGLIGLAIFLGLYTIYSFTKAVNIRTIFLMIAIPTLVVTLIYVSIINSPRLTAYLESTSDLWFILESGNELPIYMLMQSPNIYPLYDLTVKARELNILPILIGSGLGSASVINNQYSPHAGDLINPHSQLVRTLFESGIVGTLFFIMSFVYPVKRLTKYIATRDRRIFMILTLLLMGCFLGHRSAAPFIYLGLFFAAFQFLLQVNKEAYTLMPANGLSGG